MTDPTPILDQLRQASADDTSYQLPPDYMVNLTSDIVDRLEVTDTPSQKPRQPKRPYWIYICLLGGFLSVMIYQQWKQDTSSTKAPMADSTDEIMEDYLVDHSDWIDLSDLYTVPEDDLYNLEDLDISTDDLLDIIY